MFAITASRAPETDLTITVTVSRDGNFVARSNRGTKTILLEAGQGSVIYRVPTLDGSADEPDGAVYFRLEPGGGYQLGEASAASVTVADNDPGVHDGSTVPSQLAPATTQLAPDEAAPPAALSEPDADPVDLIPAVLSEEPDPLPARPAPPPQGDAVGDEAASAPIGENTGTKLATSSNRRAVSPAVPLAMMAVMAAGFVWLFVASRRRAHKP